MKTAISISAALLLAVSSFAQTSVKNSTNAKSATAVQADRSHAGISSDGSTSSSTSISSNNIDQADSKAQAAIADTKNQAANEKQAVKATASKQEKAIANSGSGNAEVSGGTSNRSGVFAGDQGNKVSENASLSGQAAGSSSTLKSAGNNVADHGKTAIEATQNTTGKTTKAVKTTVKTIKPAPAVKVNSSIKTNAAINIK